MPPRANPGDLESTHLCTHPCAARAPLREGSFGLPVEASHLGRRQDHTLAIFRLHARVFAAVFAAASASSSLCASMSQVSVS